MHIITDETIITFEHYLQENEKSKSTIEKYSSTLRKLASWLGGDGFTKARMMEYRDFMRGVQGIFRVNGKRRPVRNKRLPRPVRNTCLRTIKRNN